MMKVLCYVLCHNFRTIFQDKAPVEIVQGIESFFDQLTIDVTLAFLRFPTVTIFVQKNTNDLEWRKESILNTLLKRVGVERFAEVGSIV